MNEPITISNETPALTGMDFLALRQQGVELIEKLSGNVWTDYNLHDPGITILEQLCYAITDLSYRLSFDVPDLLAANDKDSVTGAQQFFTAREILSSNPVTILDYRKLLIDIDGVRNAWLETNPLSFAPLYYDSQAYQLAFNPTATRQKASPTGIYRVIIEKDEYVIEQDIPNLLQTVKDKLHTHRNLSEDFSIIEVLPTEIVTINADIDIADNADADMVRAKIYLALNQFISPSIRFYSLQERLQAGLMPEDIFSGPALANGFIDNTELSKFDRRKVLYKSDIYSLLLSIDGVTTVRNLSLESNKSFTEQQGWVLPLDSGSTPKYKPKDLVFKIDQVTGKDESDIKIYKKQIVTDLDVDRLQAQYVNLMADEFITIKANIKLRSHIEPHYVLAKIYRAFNQLLQIYHVIANRQGMDINDLPNLDATLISKLLLGLYDIEAVDNIIISSNKTGSGEPFTFNPNNALKFKLPAKFFIDKDVQLFQDDQPLTEIDLAKFEREVLRQTRAHADNEQIKVGYDLAVEPGLYRELNDYISIQNDFPDNYGIGQSGLSELVSEKRKAQAKQLKAYLLVFDQLLANYFAQLEASKHLLAVKPGQIADLNRTYFAQPVDGVINRTEILSADNDQQVLEQLAENAQDANRFQRKSRLLDHLLARFAEDFPDNKLLMYPEMENYNLIKQNYLSDYATISCNRFKAYNYLAQQPVWNSANVSGLERRISALLGIKDARRKVLSLGYEEGFHLVEHILLRPVDEARLARFPRAITGFKQSVVIGSQILCYSLQHGLINGEQIDLIIPEHPKKTVTVVIDTNVTSAETSTNIFKIELNDESLRSKLLATTTTAGYGWDYAKSSEATSITGFSLSVIDPQQIICESFRHNLVNGTKVQLVLPDAVVGPFLVIIDASAETSLDKFKIVVDDEILKNKLLTATSLEGYGWNKAVTAFTQSLAATQQIICDSVAHGLEDGEQIQFILPDASLSVPFWIVMDTDSETTANRFKILVEDENLRSELLTISDVAGYGWNRVNSLEYTRKFPRMLTHISVQNLISNFTQSAVTEQLICDAASHGLINGERINFILPDQSILTQLEVVMDENQAEPETGPDKFKIVITDPELRTRLLTADTSQPHRWSYDDNTYLICSNAIEHGLQEGDKIKLTAANYQTDCAVMNVLSSHQFTIKAKSEDALAALTTAHLKPVSWELADVVIDFTRDITGISPPVITSAVDGTVKVTVTTEVEHQLSEDIKIAIFDANEFYCEYEVEQNLDNNRFKIKEANLTSPLVYAMPVGVTFYYTQLPQSYAITAIVCPDKQPIDIKPVEITVTTDLQDLAVNSEVAIYTSCTKYRVYSIVEVDTDNSTFTVLETDPNSLLLQDEAVNMGWRWADAAAFSSQLQPEPSKQINNIYPETLLPEGGGSVHVTLNSKAHQLQVNDQIAIFYTGVAAKTYIVVEAEQDTFTIQETDDSSILLHGSFPNIELNWVFARELYEPYSFQISFIFPAWLPRFKDTEFRQLLTETLVRETPAHIAINILWFDRKQMSEFEQVYNNWLLRKLNNNATAGNIDTAANKVLQALHQGKPPVEYDEEIFGEISQMTVPEDFRISYPYIEGVVGKDEVGGIGHMKIRLLGNKEINTKTHHEIFQILFPDD